jgi:ubiquinone/menaquinone biosynthesis C-methylase UbiE
MIRSERADTSPWLAVVHALSRVPGAYQLQQHVAYPTTSRFRRLLERHVQIREGDRLLDLACGIGTYRDVLGGDYYGVDVNPAYIEAARRNHGGQYEVMDCCDLTFPAGMFSHVVMIAATHHLDDRQVDAAVSGALRVCQDGGALHVLDAVLPETGWRGFKTAWFRLDAGRFPRRRDDLRSRLSALGTMVEEDFVPGPLHDCAYFQIKQRNR